MLKTLRIPLISLIAPSEGGFLEFLIEPLTNNDDGFESIANGVLQVAVNQARAALRTLPENPGKSRLRLVTVDTDLSTSTGAALGLALSPWFLQIDCPYQHFIITGTLVFSNTAETAVGDSGALLEKMYAVSRLGYQVQPTLFIMPHLTISPEVKAIYQTLAQHNIAVRRVSTLAQACRAVMGN